MKTSKKMLSLLLIAAMLVSVLCMGVSATGTYDEVSIGTGEPVTINWTTATTGTVVNVDASTNYIPKSFLLWARNGLTVKVGTTELTANGVGDTDSAYTVYTDATNEITITVLNGETVAYTITCPHYTTAITGSYPSAVNGYLPVGQFARHNSFGWGTLFTDNTNKNPDTNTPKFLNGYVSTGVSLGMAGGYVQFDMGDNPIENNANNPYGIDFIVYGNAFVGNPEAAGVMVSNDGIKWYTLAGSRHYMNGTKWDQKISYVRIEGSEQRALKSTFTADGIYYSENYNSPSEQTQSAINAAISAATWHVVPATGTATALNLSYWPEWATRVVNNAAQEEYYGNVWKLGTDSHIPAVATTETAKENNAGVNWDKADTTSTVPNGAEVITYSGLTLVPDDTQVLGSNPTQAQMTDVYQWGYADVRVNGSAYGTAINPYASAASVGNGGDGFDLSWAVDENGVPVHMSSAKYIRVYSAVLFNAGIFGETSAEVCGLYRTSNTITGGAGTTSINSVAIGSDALVLSEATAYDNNTFYLDAEVANGDVITVTAASDANVYINGVASNTFTVSNTAKLVQILVQVGNAAPYILVLD
ncbi:MAG: hypothetical protein ACLSDS_01185 [Oscillospiraceae bacterium]